MMNPEFDPNIKIHTRLYDKATATVAERHKSEVDEEYVRLLNEMDDKVHAVRLFAQSHSNRPFPTLDCIKLIRHVYAMPIKEAKDIVEYAISITPEFKEEGEWKIRKYVPC